ncbi:MBL fold metallo-hydrolase [Aeromicrobium phragmitis]|uniref:MBL fold metallo-hydrolase n=1 Tax=Aeromicrobium phragmitis TaxID=2478914 RepID=A0A3L8PHU0_9ACTN|nr:MBL fold metallo-hydrolase [Aeromicrobium phragmitis]RLV54855.1 MBL fold metallo-hydrolase [Aeromicrobium phragmitis]
MTLPRRPSGDRGEPTPPSSVRVGPTRVPFGIAVLGGPTTVIDLHGLRLVVDPTFDPPGAYGYLAKTAGTAVEPDELGPVDVVLVSHDQHADNLDARGRAYARAAPLVLSTPTSAPELGPQARGLRPWERVTHHSGVRITATPAVHGPADGADPSGVVNCDVTGFLIEPPAGPVVYVAGDNASLAVVREVSDHAGHVDVAVLNAGGARVAAKFEGRPLTLTAARAAAAAEILGASRVVVAHQEGWEHFCDGADATRTAFWEAGIESVLAPSALGSWAVLDAGAT